MTAYTRRGLGTAFVSTLALLELASYAAVVLNTYLNEVDGSLALALLIAALLLILPFKLGYHIWMLFDPSISAGTGNKLKLNIFMFGTLILSTLLCFLLSVSGFSLFSVKFLFCAFIFSLPSLFSIFERVAYSTADDSESCLKHLKPFAVAFEEPEL